MIPVKSFIPALLLLAGLACPAQAQDKYPTNSAEVEAAVARLGAAMNQASNLEKLGRTAEAEPYWRQALDQRRWLLGDRNPMVAQGLDRLARNLEAQARYAEAGPLRREALALLEMGGANDAEAAGGIPVARAALGYNLAMQGDPAAGAAQAAQALDLLKAAGKLDTLDAARVLSVLGVTLDRQGLHTQAENAYRKSLDIRRRKLGEDDLDTGTSYNNLAVALSGQQRYDEAHMMFVKALEIRRKNGTVPGLVADTEVSTALNLDIQKQFGRAQVLYNQAIATWTKLYGAEDARTAAGYNGLGLSYFRQGRLEDARAQFARALRLREAGFGRSHLLTGESYGNLGIVERGLGHEEEARRLLTAALGISEATLGAGHPDTRAIRDLLGTAPPAIVTVPAPPVRKEQ